MTKYKFKILCFDHKGKSVKIHCAKMQGQTINAVSIGEAKRKFIKYLKDNKVHNGANRARNKKLKRIYYTWNDFSRILIWLNEEVKTEIDFSLDFWKNEFQK